MSEKGHGGGGSLMAKNNDYKTLKEIRQKKGKWLLALERAKLPAAKTLEINMNIITAAYIEEIKIQGGSLPSWDVIEKMLIENGIKID
jgi:hypothetical protein